MPTESDIDKLLYILTHVFCPLRLPSEDDHLVSKDLALSEEICAAVGTYGEHVRDADRPEWGRVETMLCNLSATMHSSALRSEQIDSQLKLMVLGDVNVYLIRAQNAAVIFRKQEDTTIFEAFEVSPQAGAVMGASGKLVCSYPGPAIAVPNKVFDDAVFRSELAAFLAHMNEDILDSAATSRKAGSTVVEERDTTHPRYITELLTGILRGVGRPADVNRISKRVGDDVVWNNAKLPWRRSSLWLVTRVTLQTSLERTTLGRDTYKAFMVFFIHRLAQQALKQDLPSELLHFMSSKLSRRLMKLGSSVPGWLSVMVLGTCTNVRVKLEARWKRVRVAQAASPRWAPLELDLAADTQLSLLDSQEYIHKALRNQHDSLQSKRFDPILRHRGTLDDFLSSDGKFFDAAYAAEPHLTLYDVEQAVEQGIDGWVTGVGDADDACVQLEVLAEKYSSCALETYNNNPENLSIMLLTTIELWIALDKVVVKEIPMLADYSPEVPIALLENLLLRKAGSLDRLRIAYEYVRERYSVAWSGFSVFSEAADGTNFAVRYYDSSPLLQALQCRIEQDAQRERDNTLEELARRNARHAQLKKEVANMGHDYYSDVHEWPLPSHSFEAAIVVFELDCPISFNMWRSATFNLLVNICSPSPEQIEPYIQLEGYVALWPYHQKHPRSRISLASNEKPWIVTHYRNVAIPTTRDRVCQDNGLGFFGFDTKSEIGAAHAFNLTDSSNHCAYQLPIGAYQKLQGYVQETSHTSNDVLASQSNCHKDLSIHEFLAFGHLRSGSFLQWLNILRELHGRTLTFRRHEVHLLLAQAASQVGPLSGAGEWSWHKDLSEAAFCHALLGELRSLVTSIEANWLEGVTMSTVCFLISRLLASSQDSRIKSLARCLLCEVREKSFKWVLELSEKLESIADEEIRGRLRDMAAICRGTYDVDPQDALGLLSSRWDVEILVACAIFIHDNAPSRLDGLPEESRLLLERDRRLSLALEDILGDVIDDNGEGLDLAVTRVWPAYRPGTKWRRLEHPKSRWFSCQTAKTTAQRSQEVHFNLHDGTLLVDGKPLGRLPREITLHPVYSMVFGDRVIDVIPSDVPGREFSTRGMISGYQVYFTMNGGELVVRARASDTMDFLELIPQEKLESDLPMLLVKNHVHWLNLTTSTIAVRPLESAWLHSSENWVIDLSHGAYSMRKAPPRS
ncbi:hypothetical protein HYDPIDRAFT_28723 [Hydnomerulius pinastri MD-312]|uniref:DUF6606 domain-containing protein n=1 Tax=Hydnomerulius pinastri MD-312 TaxID=994086 RepID=A0A0C9WEW6_9AGAM|nr:hypothetical protein HYDPIDRAFT_28723 [Hydnomerulius pinastri MD-312]